MSVLFSNVGVYFKYLFPFVCTSDGMKAWKCMFVVVCQSIVEKIQFSCYGLCSISFHSFMITYLLYHLILVYLNTHLAMLHLA